MTKKLTLLLLASATMLYAGKGKIRVASDVQGAYIYVDGKKKAMTGEGFTSILLEEGEHTVSVVEALSPQYQKVASKKIFVGEDTSTKITLKPEKYEPTPEYAVKLKELDKPKLQRWKKQGDVVIDTKLGLMWQDNSEIKEKTWKSANSYCKNLSLGGYNDWKLPSHDELLTIVDYDKYNPAIMSSFLNTSSESSYWTSTVSPNHQPYAWTVYFKDGNTNNESMKFKNAIRCVRNNNSLPLTIMYDLVWQDNMDAKVLKLNWEGANKYCNDLASEKYNWRLPTIKELQQIVVVNKENNAIQDKFKYVGSRDYWSSSVYILDPSNVWNIDFTYGHTGRCNPKTYKKHFRCVYTK